MRKSSGAAAWIPTAGGRDRRTAKCKSTGAAELSGGLAWGISFVWVGFVLAGGSAMHKASNAAAWIPTAGVRTEGRRGVSRPFVARC